MVETQANEPVYNRLYKDHIIWKTVQKEIENENFRQIKIASNTSFWNPTSIGEYEFNDEEPKEIDVELLYEEQEKVENLPDLAKANLQNLQRESNHSSWSARWYFKSN